MESKVHIELVNKIMKYVEKIIPETDHVMIQCDSAGNYGEIRVGNFVPDVYYCRQGRLIIGEAKTLGDFDRKHSREQYAAYLRECHLFAGESKFIIAVPWQLMITAKNYLKREKQRNKWLFEIVIINETGKEMFV